MPVIVGCPTCGQRYQVAETVLGQAVNCPQCGARFAAQASPVPQASANPPASNVGNPYSTGPYAGSPYAESATRGFQAGPTDKQFRLWSLVLLPIVIVGMLAAAFGQKQMTMGAVALLGIGPFGVFFAIAALIDPNIARAAGKYGHHLPSRYKWMAGGVGLAALICGLALSYITWTKLSGG